MLAAILRLTDAGFLERYISDVCPLAWHLPQFWVTRAFFAAETDPCMDELESSWNLALNRSQTAQVTEMINIQTSCKAVSVDVDEVTLGCCVVVSRFSRFASYVAVDEDMTTGMTMTNYIWWCWFWSADRGTGLLGLLSVVNREEKWIRQLNRTTSYKAQVDVGKPIYLRQSPDEGLLLSLMLLIYYLHVVCAWIWVPNYRHWTHPVDYTINN